MSGTLEHSPAQVVIKALVDAGKATIPVAGTDPGWPAYLDLFPDEPDLALMVKNTEPILEGRSMVDGVTFEHYGIQTLLRAIDPVAGRRKLQTILDFYERTIRNTLVTVQEEVGTGQTNYRIAAISRASGIFPLGPETQSSRRRLFSLNSIVALTQLP